MLTRVGERGRKETPWPGCKTTDTLWLQTSTPEESRPHTGNKPYEGQNKRLLRVRVYGYGQGVWKPLSLCGREP